MWNVDISLLYYYEISLDRLDNNLITFPNFSIQQFNFSYLNNFVNDTLLVIRSYARLKIFTVNREIVRCIYPFPGPMFDQFPCFGKLWTIRVSAWTHERKTNIENQ